MDREIFDPKSLVIETDEENPAIVAILPRDGSVEVAHGYRVRMRHVSSVKNSEEKSH